jgi:hypothetical protein
MCFPVLEGDTSLVDAKGGQFSFADALVTSRKGGDRLGRLSSVVKWYRFEKVLKPLGRDGAAGRPIRRF